MVRGFFRRSKRPEECGGANEVAASGPESVVRQMRLQRVSLDAQELQRQTRTRGRCSAAQLGVLARTPTPP